MTVRPSYRSESLARGLQVIRAFGHDGPRLRIADVARRTGLSRAAARRYLLTLCDLGYIGSEGDVFFLRPRLLDLGFSYLASIGVGEIVQPVLNLLSERTNASSTFAVLDSGEVVSVARAPSREIFQLMTSVGARMPAHATTLGQVLLAGLAPADLDRYLAESERVAFTKRTVTDAAELRRKLAGIRKNGYAVSRGEHVEGILAIAVPVHDRRGDVIAAVNINMYPAPTKAASAVTKHVPLLRESVGQLEAALHVHGYFVPSTTTE
jgi:IclR family pca regulon transcriptional regulator